MKTFKRVLFYTAFVPGLILILLLVIIEAAGEQAVNLINLLFRFEDWCYGRKSNHRPKRIKTTLIS